jgi:hypothetical protein
MLQVQATLENLKEQINQGGGQHVPAGLPAFEQDFLSHRVLSADPLNARTTARQAHMQLRPSGTEHGIILQGSQGGLSSIIAAAAASDSEYASLFTGVHSQHLCASLQRICRLSVQQRGILNRQNVFATRRQIVSAAATLEEGRFYL